MDYIKLSSEKKIVKKVNYHKKQSKTNLKGSRYIVAVWGMGLFFGGHILRKKHTILQDNLFPCVL